MQNTSRNYKGKIFSVLGDSLSTFEGYTPEGYVFYDRWRQAETGVTSPEDTWWMKFIAHLGGTLGVNHSLSGSMVSGRLATSGTSETRVRALGDCGPPDVILVFMGANDWGFGVFPQEFAEEYRSMIYKLKLFYPEAEIWCGTLPEGELADPEGDVFFNVDTHISRRIYSEIIRRAAGEAGVHIADLGRHNRAYTAADGVHADKKGMDLIAKLWIKELER